MALDYLLTYAGIPFVSDVARTVRLPMSHPASEDPAQLPPAKHQSPFDLMEEIDRRIPFCYLQDFKFVAGQTGATLNNIASKGPWDGPNVRVGDFYYPVGAARWGVFRGLATSRIAQAMLDATSNARNPAAFVMRCLPTNGLGTLQLNYYTIQTNLYMQPPRPLMELGGSFDGLYLITLFDERYYFQGTPSGRIHPDQVTTWSELITLLATNLGVTITVPTAIEASFFGPEADSQLWSNNENCATLLDAVAYNLGRVVVRALNGTYSLITPLESRTTVLSNRPNAQPVIRTAGGDLFYPGGSRLPVTSLAGAGNPVVPAHVYVNFPRYVAGNDPVPHFLNPRTHPQRPSTWNEDSYGMTYTVIVPITSGGPSVIPVRSGGNATLALTGISQVTLHDTAKALMSGEQQDTPANVSGLTTLALRLAQAHYDTQVAAALDEVYPGTYKWTPEGIHDIVWTYSERSRGAFTRVMRSAWNQIVTEFQHSTPPASAISAYTSHPRGVGGHSVAQTVRDTFSGSVTSGTISVYLQSPLLSGQLKAFTSGVSFLPTQNRWRGQVDNEVILFEGTSGGIMSSGSQGGYQIDIVWRAIDGSLPANHSGVLIHQVYPNTTYGTNLVTYEKMQHAYPSDWTSGGIQGVNIVPQIQTVRVMSDVTVTVSGLAYYSGTVQRYDTTTISGYVAAESVWLVERNGAQLGSGVYLDGQFAGHSILPVTRKSAPVYLANVSPPTECSPVYLTEEIAMCIDDQIEIWSHEVELNIVAGCLTKDEGPWSYDRTEGCCDCPATSSATGGSGTASICVPGVCSYCNDPPYLWEVETNSFQGNCSILNRRWVLTNTSSCVWSQTINLGQDIITAELVISSATVIQITFTRSNSQGSTLYQAIYQGQLDVGNCCRSYRLTMFSCSCGSSGSSGGSDTPCSQCTNTVTPTTWTLSATDFTGCFDHFNGGYTLTQTGACDWSSGPIEVTPGNFYIVTVSILSNGNIVLQYSGPNNNSIPTFIEFSNGESLGGNCCSPVDVVPTGFSTCGDGTETSGNYPSVIRLNPSCSNQSNDPLDCPTYVTATPRCCGGFTSGGSSGSGSGSSGSSSTGVTTDCCAMLVPLSLTMTLSNIVGGCSCFGVTSIVFTWLEGQKWRSTGPFSSCNDSYMIWECIGSAWHLYGETSGLGLNEYNGTITVSCATVYNGSGNGGGFVGMCGLFGSFDFTMTETP